MRGRDHQSFGLSLLLAFALPGAMGFVTPGFRPLDATVLCCSSSQAGPPPCRPSRVSVEPDPDSVGASVLERLEQAASSAIAERGHFALAIPGGSVLKMLEGTSPSWASKTTLAFVNHKATDDTHLSTQAKANELFLSNWIGVNVIGLSGSPDAQMEAAAYQEKLKGLPAEKLPRNTKELPVFDLMLVGVGADGHIGSLYPVRAGHDEVLDASGRWVLPVQKENGPSSITLSLPVMRSAKEVRDVLAAQFGGRSSNALVLT